MFPAENTRAVECALQALDEGKTWDEIAEVVSKETGNLISRGVCRHFFRTHHPDRINRTRENKQLQVAARHDEAIRLAEQGMTARQIADVTGYNSAHVRKVTEGFIVDGFKLRRMERRFWDIFGPPWARSYELIPDDDPILSEGKRLLDLEHSECRWPIGKDVDGQRRFCGCAAARDHRGFRPYCDKHQADALRHSCAPIPGERRNKTNRNPVFRVYNKIIGGHGVSVIDPWGDMHVSGREKETRPVGLNESAELALSA